MKTFLLLAMLSLTALGDPPPFIFAPDVVRVTHRYASEYAATLRNGETRTFSLAAGDWNQTTRGGRVEAVWRQVGTDWKELTPDKQTVRRLWRGTSTGWTSGGDRIETTADGVRLVSADAAYGWADRGGWWQATSGGLPDNAVRALANPGRRVNRHR